MSIISPNSRKGYRKKGSLSLPAITAIAIIAILSLVGNAVNKDKDKTTVYNNGQITTEATNNQLATGKDETGKEQLSTDSQTTGKNSELLQSEKPIEVHFIDVGQGDATLIKCGDKTMLIDAGDNTKGSAMKLYLQKQNISNIDIVIGTHPDADHIGGLDVVIYNFQCGTIILPDIAKDTKTYEDLIYNINYKNYKITRPVVGQTYMLGEARVTILGPVKKYGDNANNHSVVVKLDYGDTSFVFSGDAGEEAESDIIGTGLDISADVYKVGHHGSYTSSSLPYLKAIKPTYAVISCGTDNKYGHPHTEVLDRLKDMKVTTFRTDLQGDIIAYSDGTNIWWTTSK